MFYSLSSLLSVILFYNLIINITHVPYCRLLIVKISSCYLVAFKCYEHEKTHHKGKFLIQSTQHRDWKVAVHE